MRFDLRENTPFLLYRITSRLGSEGNVAFRKVGVTTMTARILLALLSQDDVMINDLCQFTAIDQSTMSHALDGLRRRELVSKHRQEEDNRAVRVKLTTKGREVALGCTKIARVFDQIFLDGMSNEDVETLKSLLRRLYDNLERGYQPAPAKKSAPSKPGLGSRRRTVRLPT